MDEKPKVSPPPAKPHGDELPATRREHRWTEKRDDTSPKHEGPQPEGNGGTAGPASFPPHP
jgi:hypothetical protein